jgi:N-acylneuraminate cytidylyltransferase
VYAQNASLEIAWSRVVLEGGTIAGRNVLPFFTHGFEGFDINRPEDWVLAEHYLQTGEATLPEL